MDPQVQEALARDAAAWGDFEMEINEWLEDAARRSTLPPSDAPPAPARTRGVRRILVVDDNENVGLAMAKVCKQILGGHGDVDVAMSGNEAISWMATHSYDLVLTDLSMPNGLSGMQLVDWIRRHRKGQKVAVMSGAASRDDLRNIALACEADYWLPKPVAAEDVEKILDEIVAVGERLY